MTGVFKTRYLRNNVSYVVNFAIKIFTIAAKVTISGGESKFLLSPPGH